MTIAIALTENNNKLIMVDTAISTNINGKYYRTGTTQDKCFIKDNSLIFCSGNVFLADKVRCFINQSKEIDVTKICEYAKMEYNKFITLYPNKKDAKLWVWIVDKDNFWQFGINGDFKIENYKSKELFQYFCGHFEENGDLINDNNIVSNKILEYIRQNITLNKELTECFVDIAKHYNCEAVGDTVMFFSFDNDTNTFKHLKDVKIDNKYVYTNEELKQISNLDIDGNVVMKGTLNIVNKLLVDGAGNLTIHGGDIKWASSDPSIAIAQNSANSALSVAQNAQSSASTAYSIANLAGTNISKLADGTYTSGTFINGKRIEAPEIYGGKISGIDIIGSYFRGSTANSAYLTLGASTGGNYGDLRLHRGDGELTFSIYDNLTRVDLKSLGTTFLASSGDKTYPEGTWNFNGTDEVDFTGTNVKGIVARFA